MTLFGILGFTTPWLLLSLIALPILWIILRAVPPAPIRRRFPGVALLLGLKDEEQVSDRTPWWLLLLRMLAVAAVIVGLAGPILNPETERQPGQGPLMVLMDGSWAGADGWTRRQEVLDGLLSEAGRAERPVAMVQLSRPDAPVFQSADSWRTRLAGFAPTAWQPGNEEVDDLIASLGEDGFDTYWLSDGLDYSGRDALIDALQARGDLRVFQDAATVLAIMPVTFEDGEVRMTLRRSAATGASDAVIEAHGRDPAGVPTVLATATASFDGGATTAETALILPAELRARITHFEIQGVQSAGAVTLSGDGLRRREVALIAGSDDREGLDLLSPLHYLEQALIPSADLLDGALNDVLPANPDVIVLADVATLSEGETAELTEWVESGGLLLRFAGPRLAASDVSRAEEDPLMPVRLRAGGRTVGGAMSWGEPKALAPFAEDSPFFGLDIPSDVTVTAQVMAQPDPTLSERVIAQLTDGTPLVTRKRVGQGQVILFHVTANAEWSSLPLSGLFVQMLERLAIASGVGLPEAEDLAGTIWQPERVLDGRGTLRDAGTLPGVDGEVLATDPLGPDLQPGLYRSEDRVIVRNTVTEETDLTPASWPSDVPVEGLTTPDETPLGGWFLSAALLLLLADIVASLALSGRLRGAATAAIAVLALGLPQVGEAQGSDADAAALAATSEVVLAHVVTGNAQVDDVARAGLVGLSETLFFRTSVEPADPMGVNLETDELAFYPMLYWPITPDQPLPSDVAYAKLNEYLRSGGMILFDTRDADVARFGASSPNGRKLQQLAAPLDIPPLEPVPQDHVLTRTFYLLQDFPGRYASRDVWVEAAPADAEQIEGMPFRNLNDGVTPVVIGGNDWGAAWAMDNRGNALFPVGRGYGGERQRELAYRFGVNLVMHVLTGNYKSDQVHVPALLDRLGQ